MKHLKNLSPNARGFIRVALFSTAVIALSACIIKKNNQIIDEWADENPEYWNS